VSKSSLLAAGAVAALCASLTAQTAVAFEYRRPNLVGPYTDRRMTNPVNAMTLVGGPGTSFTFGQRYDERNTEGGFELGHYRAQAETATSSVDEAWTRFGIGFGLLPYLDAGAVFLNFKWAPNFDFTEVLVYVTQAFNLGDLELGVRFSFLSPSKENGWQFNPGLLAVYRGGRYKLEAGAFTAIGAGSFLWEADLVPGSEYIGLNVPLRGSFNITPHWYVGGDSGLAVPRFDAPERTTVPLGFLVGYTLLAGSRLLDISAAFKWDEFLYLAPASGVDAIQPAIYRFNVGITMHKMAVAPPK
jgi:hypothetical protein